MSKFVETTYANKKEILKFPDHYVAMTVTVDDEGIAADPETGKKIVPAGTIVGGKATPVMGSLTEPVVSKNTAVLGSTAEGILKNDVDVTHGPASGAMIIHGFIAKDNLPEAPVTEAVTPLKQIFFIK